MFYYRCIAFVHSSIKKLSYISFLSSFFFFVEIEIIFYLNLHLHIYTSGFFYYHLNIIYLKLVEYRVLEINLFHNFYFSIGQTNPSLIVSTRTLIDQSDSAIVREHFIARFFSFFESKNDAHLLHIYVHIHMYIYSIS